MSTMDACGNLTIKHLQALITNTAQKQNEHCRCMWNCNNQALTSYDHKMWHRSIMSIMDASEILTIKHSLPVVTNMAQKHSEHHGYMWNSDNQVHTSCSHKHDTEAEWASCMHVEFWQSSTHILCLQIWHRSRMSTMHASEILTIKHSHPVFTNMAQKQNEHHRCMWTSDNQALTRFDYKHGTEAEWASCMHMGFWQSRTHLLWSQTWHRSRMSIIHACDILTIKYWLSVITDIAQKQNEHYECMWYPDNQVLTSCDHNHCTETEWAPWMHVGFWKPSTHFLQSQIWHRSRVSTVDGCEILTILYSHTVITNMAQK